MIHFKVHIALKDYRKLNFMLVYKRPMTLFVSFIGLMNLMACVLYGLGYGRDFMTAPLSNLLLGFFCAGLVPLSIFYNSKKTYDVNKYLQEESEWSVDENKIKIKGKSFESEYDWTNIYQIKRVGDWILIYKDRIICNFIPLYAFASSADYDLFLDYMHKNNVKIK